MPSLECRAVDEIVRRPDRNSIFHMQLILVLAGVSIIPIALVAFLPRKESFFAHGAVRGFGLGIYLMLVVVLFTEAVEGGGSLAGTIWLLVGLLVSFLIGLSLKEFHHHHTEEDRAHSHSRASTSRILVSDFFHNIVDGMAIITGFAISPAVGAISFLGVLGHQILQQVGQHILLVESGIEAKRALIISFFVSLSVFIAFLIEGESIEATLLALSAGIVAWKVWTDLVHATWDKKTITGFLAGALVLAIVLLSIPHGH